MHRARPRTIRCPGILAALLTTACLAQASHAEDEKTLGRAILEASGFTGGLIVHLDSGDGPLTAALRVDDRTIVHGLDREAADVATAREHLRSAGEYGPVAVESWEGPGLPYADNLVNLVVVSGEWRAVSGEW